MPWTAENQKQAEAEATTNLKGYIQRIQAWENAVRSGKPFGTEHAALKEHIRLWHQNLEHLKSQSDAIVSNDSVMDDLGQLVTRLAEDKAEFDKLTVEAGTRTNQADSVNPKIRSSPYTNILGLNRIFRPSAQFGILIASIVFGILALAVLAYIVYVVQTNESPVLSSFRGGLRLEHRT